jgi:HSP20 family molecular chaperone IbpA
MENHTQERISVHLMEIDHGAFCREVELPDDVHRDRIVASHRNGLLWIELPKK